MRVVTFAPSLTVSEDEDGGVSGRGFPMTVGFVDQLPADITIPVIVAVCALCGDEYDTSLFIGVTSPEGERVSTMQFNWHWEDNPEGPVKYRVFAQQLPVPVVSPGIYTLGLYESLEATETEYIYPLPLFLNPIGPAPSGL